MVRVPVNTMAEGNSRPAGARPAGEYMAAPSKQRKALVRAASKNKKKKRRGIGDGLDNMLIPKKAYEGETHEFLGSHLQQQDAHP
jgi:hypothetical protein